MASRRFSLLFATREERFQDEFQSAVAIAQSTISLEAVKPIDQVILHSSVELLASRRPSRRTKSALVLGLILEVACPRHGDGIRRRFHHRQLVKESARTRSNSDFMLVLLGNRSRSGVVASSRKRHMWHVITDRPEPLPLAEKLRLGGGSHAPLRLLARTVQAPPITAFGSARHQNDSHRLGGA